MLFNTLVFSTIAALVASAQAQDNSCAAGAIIGIFGVCGTNPVDCKNDLCCLEGQKCVTSGSKVACADSSLQSGTTLTVSAGCYGTMTKSGSTSSSTGKPTDTKSNPATIVTPTGSSTGASGSYSATAPVSSSKEPTHSGSKEPTGSGSKGPTGSGSKGPGPTETGSNTPVAPTGATGFVSAPPYTYTNGTARPSGIATGSGKPSATATGVLQSNGAGSAFTSPQNTVAILLSAVAVVAFWL